MRTLVLLLVAGTVIPAQDCTSPVRDGGDRAQSKFFPVSLERVREAAADAMQAAGFILFKDTEKVLEGERAKERTELLGLPKGDEALFVTLEERDAEGHRGTLIHAETRRPGGRTGDPSRRWSEGVLAEMACLINLLSAQPPEAIAFTPGDRSSFKIPDGTPIPLVLRRFVFSSEIDNKVVTLETAADLRFGNAVLPRGTPARARGRLMRDISTFGRGAVGVIQINSLVLPNGVRIPLEGSIQGEGKNVGAARLAIGGALLGVGAASGTFGRGFAIRAGTRFSAQVVGDHLVTIE